MSARKFFVFYKAMKRIKALEHYEQCDIAIIPSQDPKYWESLKEVYRNQFEPDRKAKILAEVAAANREPLKGEAARAGVFALFAAVKGEVPH